MPNPYTGTQNDPIQQAQHNYLGKDWEKFFGSLQGANVRFTPSGYGQPPQATGTLGPGPEFDTARNYAVDAYGDQQKLGAQQLRAATSQSDLMAQAVKEGQGQLDDRAALDAALQGGAVATPIVQRGKGMYTQSPDPNAPVLDPVAARVAVLAKLPGHLRPAYEKQFAAQDAAAQGMQLATRKQTEVERHDKALEDAKTAAGEPSADVVDSVTGMKEGHLPPQLPGRASKDYTAIMAEAKRQGYDLAGAATDWTATQKHIATMNGAQQLRLNQSVNQLPELLDSVDSLASKWKAGKFPLLNKANLALAKGGAFGQEAASVANQLDAQIADVTADLGNVYMGGNSPTDHALGLAAKSLDSSWDEKVLHDMVDLARNNVKIRQNSIRNTGVQGASATNPYGNQPASSAATVPPAPAGFVEMVAPDGRPLHVPAGQVDALLKHGAKKAGG